MEIFELESTSRSPYVLFDEYNNTLLIQGKSFLSNAEEFYNKIIHKIKEYYKSTNSKLTVTLDFDYFNTSSSKMLYYMLIELKKHNSLIIWVYEDDDDDMEEAGQDLCGIMKTIPFEFKIKK